MFDVALRAPFLASIVMCICTAVVGVLIFVRKRLLLGETLSHATYPGVVLSGFAAAFFLDPHDGIAALLVLVFAFVFAFAGYLLVEYLENRCSLSSDNALCFTLAFFLGTGVLFASILQGESPVWHRKVQSYLYGQVATLSEVHVNMYAALLAFVVCFVTVRHREIQLFSFDQTYAAVVGMKTKWLTSVSTLLLALSIVIGIRSVGVILVSGMLIAPAIVARQLCDRLSRMYVVAAVVGGVSAALGFGLSLLFSRAAHVSMPEGPLILLVASGIAISMMFVAPKNGLLFRLARQVVFHLTCQCENVLKTMWKRGGDRALPIKEVFGAHSFNWVTKGVLLWKLRSEGWIMRVSPRSMQLTHDGYKKAAHIVRLHRLWEVYLVKHLGVSAKKVHRSAEEIEHILTPELEKMLYSFVGGSTHDPHEKPIPPRGGAV